MTQPARPVAPNMQPAHGLTDTTVASLHRVLERYAQVEKAMLYGSRAKGNFQPGSDIDLTLYGHGLSHDVLAEISSDLDDLLLPYTIDLSIFDQLENGQLRQHIEQVGRVLYQRPIDTKSFGAS